MFFSHQRLHNMNLLREHRYISQWALCRVVLYLRVIITLTFLRELQYHNSSRHHPHKVSSSNRNLPVAQIKHILSSCPTNILDPRITPLPLHVSSNSSHNSKIHRRHNRINDNLNLSLYLHLRQIQEVNHKCSHNPHNQHTRKSDSASPISINRLTVSIILQLQLLLRCLYECINRSLYERRLEYQITLYMLLLSSSRDRFHQVKAQPLIVNINRSNSNHNINNSNLLSSRNSFNKPVLHSQQRLKIQ